MLPFPLRIKNLCFSHITLSINYELDFRVSLIIYT